MVGVVANQNITGMDPRMDGCEEQFSKIPIDENRIAVPYISSYQG
jgi:hypothetical protein